MMDEPTVTLTGPELKKLMQEAVEDAFVKMGIDIADPLEMQRDFQHLREWRVAVAAMRNRGMFTVMTIALAGIAGAMWLGFKIMVQQS